MSNSSSSYYEADGSSSNLSSLENSPCVKK